MLELIAAVAFEAFEILGYSVLTGAESCLSGSDDGVFDAVVIE